MNGYTLPVEKATMWGILEGLLPATTAWDVGVHGPGQVFAAGRAEFPSGHVDDVASPRQLAMASTIKQLAGNAFDAQGLQLYLKAWFTEPRNAEKLVFW